MIRTHPPSTRASVLVVEDDTDIRELFRMALEDEGFRVIEAANGIEALRRLRGGEPVGLIVLDLDMPFMNGWQFRAEQLRDPAIASIPVVVVSGVLDQGPPIQAAAVARKPLTSEQLVQLVKRHFSP